MPIPIASPPRLIRFALSPAYFMSMNASSSDSGSIAVTMSALRTLPRKRKRMTTMSTAPSISASRTVPTARVDELRLVVVRLDPNAGRQRSVDLRHLGLDGGDHLRRVLVDALEDDARDDLALAVHRRGAAPHLGPERDGRDVPDVHRRAAALGDDDVAEVVQTLGEADPADQVLLRPAHDEAAADVAVVGAEGLAAPRRA